MRVEFRKLPYDLIAVAAASTLLVLMIIINEATGAQVRALRVILGLPFILFFPGYVLISALYPGRKKYVNEDGSEVPPSSEREDEEGDYEEWPKGKGLDGLERIALSLGLSIAITPLIGLFLSWTYEWDPEHLGIRLLPILFSQYTFILIVGSVAYVRRLRTPVPDRFGISIVLSMPGDYSRTDRILTVGIVIMMLMSVGMLVYIIVVPREGEAFTELYILGSGGKADDYPRNFLLEEKMSMFVGIANHENRKMNYTLVLTIEGRAQNYSVGDLDNITISRSIQPSLEVHLQDQEKVELPCNFSVIEIGSFKLRFLLFADGEQYLDTHIWIKVFQEGYLVRSPSEGVELYLAGSMGDPALLETSTGAGDPIILTIGFRNLGNEDKEVNFTLGAGNVERWHSFSPSEGPADLGNGTGIYILQGINGTSSWASWDLIVVMPLGESGIMLSCEWDGSTLGIVHKMEVSD
ncbi:MAG: DUF1616 domain-containing protein [Thermoplasmatota archaeon]